VVLCNAPLRSFAVFSHTLRFYARLHEVAAVHNAGIGMGVVDQQWRHCLLLFFYMFWLISKNFLFAILSFFIYADFIRYGLK